MPGSREHLARHRTSPCQGATRRAISSRSGDCDHIAAELHQRSLQHGRHPPARTNPERQGGKSTPGSPYRVWFGGSVGKEPKT